MAFSMGILRAGERVGSSSTEGNSGGGWYGEYVDLTFRGALDRTGLESRIGVWKRTGDPGPGVDGACGRGKAEDGNTKSRGCWGTVVSA